MGLLQSDGHMELNCNADEFFEIFTHKPYLIPKMSPKKMPNVVLHEGKNWQEVGAGVTWTYVLNGERAYANTRLEDIDDVNRFVRYRVEGGHIMNKYYKTLYANIQATPKGNGNCIVTWSFEYEKMYEDAIEPKKFLDSLFISIAKDVDASLYHA